MGRGLWGMFLLAPFVVAVGTDGPDEPAEMGESLGDDAMKATSIGVRFTPEIAKAIGRRMAESMKSRYELDAGQVEDVQGVISRRLMRMVQDNAEAGRDMIELMMATTIANDGGFPKEEAIKFAKLSQQIIPAMRDFFTKSSGEIGKKLTMKQRLMLTGDMAGATAGLVAFENRMKRWEEGDVGSNANPFFDTPNSDLSADNSAPEDPNEDPEHRKARQQVERWIDWRINPDRNWEAYVDQAITFYAFDEAQTASAKAILKDCTKQAESIKSAKWRDAIKENQVLIQMARRSGDAKFHEGPWMYNLERAYENHMKPLVDLGDELKRRVEGVATSSQRAAASDAAKKRFAIKGVILMPA